MANTAVSELEELHQQLAALKAELAQTQATLHISQSLLERVSEGVSFINTQGEYVLTNATFRSLIQLEDTANSKVFDLLMGVISPAMMQQMETAMVEKGTWTGQVPFKHDTSVVMAHTSIEHVYDEDKNIIGSTVVARDITKQMELELNNDIFYALVQQAQDGIVLSDANLTICIANPAFHRMLGYADNELIGTSHMALVDQSREQIEQVGQEVHTHGTYANNVNFRKKDGSSMFAHGSTSLLQDPQHDTHMYVSIYRDLTEHQQAEQERFALQEQVIMAQQAALRELSTPIIPLNNNLVVMPLIGTIDSTRTNQIIESLLHGAAQLQSGTTIIDITGVNVVDTQVANALLRAAQAVKLLGVQVIITGIRPEVAQTLVGLGVDLTSITTRSTLQAGIAYAMK